MAKKISELTTISSLDSSDVLPIVDVSANTTNKVTSSNLVQGVVGSFSDLTTTDKTSIVNALNEVKGYNEYSTTEKVVGKWIDNKPIYRKVYTQSNTNNISNVATGNDTIVKMECLVRRTGTNAWRSLPWLFVSSDTYGGASWAGGFYFNNNTINFQLGSTLSTIDKLIFIIEYTKTTD